MTKYRDLAAWFLGDCDPACTDKQINSLAAAINEAVENWLEDNGGVRRSMLLSRCGGSN